MPYYAVPPPHPEHEPLPSYEVAIRRDPLSLVAPYLRPADLFPCLLVSRVWHDALLPYVWKDPARFWGMGEKSELYSFTLFLRSLSGGGAPKGARWTRCVDLTQVRTGVYTALPTSWLADLLTRLPEMKVLRVTEFAPVNHAALVAAAAATAAAIAAGRHYKLRILHIRGCRNCTPTGLAGLLAPLQELEEVDLSSTVGAGSREVLEVVSQLRVKRLGLAGCQLSDNVVAGVVEKVGMRLAALDVRGNLLSDVAVGWLLDYAVAPPLYADELVEEEGGEGRGLSELLISGNRVSVGAAKGLMQTGRFSVLDIGKPQGGVTGLVAALGVYTFRSLRTFRVHCELVMGDGGLKRGVVRELRRIVLTSVPEWTQKQAVHRLVAFVQGGGDKLDTVELEMVGGDEEAGGMLEGSFSFFGGEEEEGGSVWADGDGEQKVETLDALKNSREGGKGVRKILVLRDFGGVEVRELGADAERWGIVRERV